MPFIPVKLVLFKKIPVTQHSINLGVINIPGGSHTKYEFSNIPAVEDGTVWIWRWTMRILFKANGQFEAQCITFLI